MAFALPSCAAAGAVSCPVLTTGEYCCASASTTVKSSQTCKRFVASAWDKHFWLGFGFGCTCCLSVSVSVFLSCLSSLSRLSALSVQSVCLSLSVCVVRGACQHDSPRRHEPLLFTSLSSPHFSSPRPPTCPVKELQAPWMTMRRDNNQGRLQEPSEDHQSGSSSLARRTQPWTFWSQCTLLEVQSPLDRALSWQAPKSSLGSKTTFPYLARVW